MKITEIRNKLFGLSDLKSLIKENSFDEAADWGTFFADNPEYLDKSFEPVWNSGKLDDYLDSESMNNLKNADPTIRQAEKMRLRAKFNPAKTFYNKKRKAQQMANATSDYQLAQSQNNLPTVEEPVSVQVIDEKELQRLFIENGGDRLVFPGGEGREFINYANKVKELADIVYNKEQLSLPYTPSAGNIADPFSLFLLFYYCCSPKGKGNKNKINVYLKRIKSFYAREYIKYLVNYSEEPNIFKIILGCSPVNIANVGELLKKNGFGGNEFASLRSEIYFERYCNTFMNNIGEKDLLNISSLFEYPSNLLFDPVSQIDEKRISQGLQKLCRKDPQYNGSVNAGDALNILKKPTFVTETSEGAPIEKIFNMAKTISGLLNTDFGSNSKFGASGRNVLNTPEPTERIRILFESATDGVAMLVNDARVRGLQKMPKPIAELETFCKGKVKEQSELKFWELLKRDSNTKTQDEILNFLRSVSDPSVKWGDEYNRFGGKIAREKEEDGLGDKTIDIIGTKVFGNVGIPGNEKTLCFEYQGECHYRPVCVRQTDNDYTLFSAMRDEILDRCGFKARVGENGTKYYSGIENFKSEDAKGIIIEVYESYVNKLQNNLAGTPGMGAGIKVKDFVVTEASVLGRRTYASMLPEYTIKEALDYFKTVLSKRDDPNLFEPASLNGIAPYLCSPVRFLDEVLTANARERDLVKNSIIKKRASTGWKLAYVTPSISAAFSMEDLNYTIKEVANGDMVFQWNDEGKREIIQYLQDESFMDKPKQQVAESLFEEIVREIIMDAVPL